MIPSHTALETSPSPGVLFGGMPLEGENRPGNGVLGGRGEALQYLLFKRYYSQHLARFLSTDPVGGKVGSSQSWNKYVYVENDPINNIDPFGDVKFATNKAKENYDIAVAYLRHSEVAASVISQFESITGDLEPTITLNSSDLTHFSGRRRNVDWDPNSGMNVFGCGGKADSEGGWVQSPALSLLHEMGHAVMYATNPEKQYKLGQKQHHKYGNKEEKRVITKIETPAAKQLNEPTRKNSLYNKFVRTPGPDSKVVMTEEGYKFQ